MRAHVFGIIALVLITVFALAMLGCGKATDPTTDFTFPLNVGNRWEYTTQLTASNIRGDSTAVVNALADSDLGPIQLEIAAFDTLLEGIASYEMVTTTEFGSGSRIDSGRTYLNNEINGLYIYASDNRIGISLYKPGVPRYALRQNGKSYTSIEDYIVQTAKEVPTEAGDGDLPPVYAVYYQTLAYPMVVGREWPALTDDPYAYTKKSIIGYGDITVPAGTFSCYAIKSDLILINGIDYVAPSQRVDYYSTQGLVKRVITGYDIAIVDYNNTMLGIADITSEYVLTSYSIH